MNMPTEQELHKIMVDSLQQAAVQVFATMLGVEIAPGPVSVERGAQEPNDGVVSFIGLGGGWAGTGSVTCSPALACRVCSHMLLTESTAVNEEVLDAVAELTNMIVGSVKTDLENHLGPLCLSIPTVVFGRNFKTKSAGTSEWIVVRFDWEGESFLVKLCLAPQERRVPVHAHAPVSACALEVPGLAPAV